MLLGQSGPLVDAPDGPGTCQAVFSSTSLPAKLLVNRRHHEVHEDDTVRHAVQPERR
jgi:hypothetical protein